MTSEKFIRGLEEYYGKYPPLVRAAVVQWATSKDPEFLFVLAQEVIKRYAVSEMYGKPVDVALLIRLHDELYPAFFDKKLQDRLLIEGVPECTEAEHKLGLRFVAAIAEAFEKKINPKDDPEVQAIIAEGHKLSNGEAM